MVPGLVCDVGGMFPRTSMLLWGAWIYPTAFLLASLAGWMSLRRDGWRWWLIPIPLLNLWLAVVYATLLLAYLGIPLGQGSDALHVAYAMVQCFTVNFLYIFFPILNLWPILLLPESPRRKWLARLNVVPALVCLLLLGLNIVLLPRGWQIAASWRQDVAAGLKMPQSRDFRAGVVLRIATDPFPTDEEFQTELAQLRDLGAEAVNLFVHDDLMQDDQHAASLERFLERLRSSGVTIILTADYPQSWAIHPPTSPEEVLAQMQAFQQFLAVRYKPDVLVPFIEPYGAFVVLSRQTYSAQQWEDLLARAIRPIHAAAPEVQCAVYLGSTANDAALYRRVCQANSPVDVLGFSFYAIFQTRGEMEEVLAKVAEWIRQAGSDKPHWVFEFGQSPLTMGGELAQSGYIQTVTRWALRQPVMHGVCVFALGDYVEKTGLITSTGRRRPAWYDYRREFIERRVE